MLATSQSSLKSYLICNDATRISYNTTTAFAYGSFKEVFKGSYTIGVRIGQAAVCKRFKSGSVFEESYFAMDLKVVERAHQVILAFNDRNVTNSLVYVIQPEIWTSLDGSNEKWIAEPYIENFVKVNSSTGWTNDKASEWYDYLQALSHHSYHASNGSILLCDIQGAMSGKGFTITDPVIMSTTCSFGPTDFGAPGISTFFSSHKCNKFCNSGWLLPSNLNRYFKKQEGSMMGLKTEAAANATILDQFRGLSIIEEE